MKFGIKEWRHVWSVGLLCNVMQLTTRGFRKWAGDISYIWTAQGWLDLAVILDLNSRRIVGWPFDWAQGPATA